MRQILESLGIPTETPPPVPQPSPPPIVVQTLPPPLESQERYEVETQEGANDRRRRGEEQLTDEERLAMERLAQGASVTRQRKKHTRTSRDIRQLLRGGHAKTAFVLKEVLDNPKCFDT